MPKYRFMCPTCSFSTDIYMSYKDFDQVKEDNLRFRCQNDHRHYLTRVLEPPIFHLKGYGFYTTDNRDIGEKYAFDHFDGSGTNAEMKAMDRRIKDPESTVPKGE